MSVHVIIDIKPFNKDLYAEYVRKVPSIIQKYGGRYLARGNKITTIEGVWHPERIIILEFDSARQVNDWLNSPEYAEIVALRENSTIANSIMIEGGELP